MKAVEINSRLIGPGHPCFIVAEAGVNHNGSLETAWELVNVAKAAGADAVKFQTFRAEQFVSSAAPKAKYQLQQTDPTESQFEMLRRLQLSPEAHRELHTYCQKRSVLFLSTPFDEASVDMLDDLGLAAFKIGSGEITNWPLLDYIARKGKPIILSTGMSFLSEVDEAVRIIRSAKCDQLALLHCVSTYPADASDANLYAMRTLAAAFDVPVGYSDHTSGIEVALAAVALGACIIEKHFTISRRLPGPDQLASLEPQELREMVAGIRTVEASLGTGVKWPASSEGENRLVARRSLAAACNICEGAVIQPEMLRALRPASGLSPALIEYVVGRKARRPLMVGQLISWGDIE